MGDYYTNECPECSNKFNFIEYIYSKLHSNTLDISTEHGINSVEIVCDNCKETHERLLPSKLMGNLLKYSIEIIKNNGVIIGEQ